MKIIYLGNFDPPHSTENHIARALEHNGHVVQRVQENVVDNWYHLAQGGLGIPDCDFIMWTRTGWDWPRLGISSTEMVALQAMFLLRASRLGKPTVGYHLDIWWGLEREAQVAREPFFRVDLLITADGGHEEKWEEAGVNHVWFPPAVSLAECEPGMFRSDLASPLAFVGNWRGEYHQESQHRFQLVTWLQENFRRDCAFWPRPGEHALRGADLRDLYASTEVDIGDSCFCGTGLENYWSDRIPETLGRGGFLLHPEVAGMSGQGFNGKTMGVWDVGDWDHLGNLIQWALDNPEDRKAVAAEGKRLVVQRHTYEKRMEQLINHLMVRGFLPIPFKAPAPAKKAVPKKAAAKKVAARRAPAKKATS